VYGSAAPAIEPGGAAQQFGKCAAEVGAAPDDVTVVAVIAQGQIGCLQGLDDSRAAGFLPDVEMIEPRDQFSSANACTFSSKRRMTSMRSAM
jgi:hypothetical protein